MCVAVLSRARAPRRHASPGAAADDDPRRVSTLIRCEHRSPRPRWQVDAHLVTAPAARSASRPRRSAPAADRHRVGQRGVPARLGPHRPGPSAGARRAPHRHGAPVGTRTCSRSPPAGARPGPCGRSHRLLPMAVGGLRPRPGADHRRLGLHGSCGTRSLPRLSPGSWAHCTSRPPRKRRAARSGGCPLPSAATPWPRHWPVLRSHNDPGSRGCGRRPFTHSLHEGPDLWLHGDLHGLNVLAVRGRISGVIDFGDLCAGDPATDLACGWLLLDRPGRERMREVLAVGDATWARGRGWALFFGLMFLAHSADSPVNGAIGRRTLSQVLDGAPEGES